MLAKETEKRKSWDQKGHASPHPQTECERQTENACTHMLSRGLAVRRKPQRREQLLLFPWRQSPVGSG